MSTIRRVCAGLACAAVFWSLVSCGRRGGEDAPRPATSASPGTSVALAAIGSPPAPSSYVPPDPASFELLRRQERELAALRDPLRLAAVDDRVRFPAWTGPSATPSPFPARKIASARGYAFQFVSLEGPPAPPECDGEIPWIVAHDGRLCPSVVGEGIALTPVQIARLVALVRTPGPVEERWRCGYQPHHAFVLFDESGAPFGQVGACFTCNEWRAQPPLPSTDASMGRALGDGLRQLCRELGLGGCGYDQATDWAVRSARSDRFLAREREGDLGPEPTEPLPDASAGVDLDKRLSDLDDRERRRLCALHVRRLRDGAPGRAGEAILCSPTETRRLLGFRSCLAAFPRSDARVFEAEACIRATSRDVCDREACDPRRLVGVAP